MLTILRDLQRRVHGTAPALLLAEAIERLRVRAIVMARSADQAVRSLANIDGLLERARSYGVRGFVQFARDIDEEWSSGAGHAEGMVEADGQSIEIVTVHSSKGLEWPVVIPINRASMPRRAEKFVYRRSDESLHWALGQIIPPSLGDALQAEEIEKRNENLRLLYVACTRAMELLIVPDFSWSNDASWAKLLDFQLGEVPELNIARLPRKPAAAEIPLKTSKVRKSLPPNNPGSSRLLRAFGGSDPAMAIRILLPSKLLPNSAGKSRLDLLPPSRAAACAACSSTSLWKS